MDKPGVGIQPGFFYLPGQVQQRRAGVHRLHQRAYGVTRARAGAGQRHAKAGKTSVGISHGDRPRFAACRYKADVAALPYCIRDGQVVNRDDAVDGLNLILLQRSGDGVADGYHFAHCSPFLSRTSG